MIRKPTLSYGKWTLSWRHRRGWKHHDREISHFLTFTLLPIHLGLSPPRFFQQQLLRDRAQEATRRHCSRSTELVLSWAQSARKQHPIFQMCSSLWRKNIHPPTTTPATSEYLPKFANTLSAQINWCFLLGTLQDTRFRCNFDDPRFGGIPSFMWNSLSQADHVLRVTRTSRPRDMPFPLSKRYQWREDRCILLIRKQLSEQQEVTQPKLLMQSLRSLQVPDFCSS